MARCCQKIIGSWFDYLLVSRKEMEAILDGTGWEVGKTLSDAVTAT